LTLSCLDSLCSFSTDTVVELRSMAFFWVLYIQTHRIEIVIFCVVVPWYSYLLGRWQPLPWQYRVKVNLLEQAASSSENLLICKLELI